MAEEIKSIFAYCPEYEDYTNNEDKINTETVIFVEEIGKEKIITQGKEFNFVPSKAKNGQILSYSDENGLEWMDSNIKIDSPWVKGDGINSAVLNGGANNAEGRYSVAEGHSTNASGQNSHAEGYSTNAKGNYSHAEGYYTHALGEYSHAEGNYTTAKGDYSHAEGQYTNANAIFTHAEGYSTNANGIYSHAEGFYTNANEYYSHAEGDSTNANGYSSHAEGTVTNADGDYSHAGGYHTNAKNIAEHSSGQFNNSTQKNADVFGDSDNTLFSVGNGASDTTRHNAFEIKQNGDIYIPDTDASDKHYSMPMMHLQGKLQELDEKANNISTLSEEEIESIFNNIYND